MKWLKSALFKMLMWRVKREQQVFDQGYDCGWYNCLHAVQSGEMPVVLPRVQGSIPIRQERHTEQIPTQILPDGRPLLKFIEAQRAGAGRHTAMERAIPRRPYSTVKLSPDSDRR